MSDSDTSLSTLFVSLAASGAAMAVRSLSKKAFESRAETSVPENPAEDDTPWTHALLWGVAVGVLTGVARVLARRVADPVTRT